jgi:hypothetical protein
VRKGWIWPNFWIDTASFSLVEGGREPAPVVLLAEQQRRQRLHAEAAGLPSLARGDTVILTEITEVTARLTCNVLLRDP